MRLISRLKLLLGALLVVALVAVLTRHLDQQMSTVHDLSATLRSQEYALGTDYAGILADQYVESGDEVAAGDPIAVIKSNLLSRDIANGLVDPKNVTLRDPRREHAGAPRDVGRDGDQRTVHRGRLHPGRHRPGAGPREGAPRTSRPGSC